jgi:hypothetical protein
MQLMESFVESESNDEIHRKIDPLQLENNKTNNNDNSSGYNKRSSNTSMNIVRKSRRVFLFQFQEYDFSHSTAAGRHANT